MRQRLYLVIIISIILSIAGWFGAAFVDYKYDSTDDVSFKDYLYFDLPAGELYGRSIIVLCCFASGMFYYGISEKSNKMIEETLKSCIVSCRGVEQSPMSIIITDLDEKIISINSMFCKMFGYEREEVLGKHPSILNAEEDYINIQKSITNKILQGKSWKGRILNKKKDGTIFLIESTIGPIFDQEEKVIAYIGYQQDMRVIQELEYDKSMTHNKYRSIFESAPVFLNFVDSKGIIIDCNSMSEILLGYKKEEIIGKHYSKFIHSSYWPKAEEELETVKRGESLSYRFSDYKLLRKDGEVINARARTVPFLDSNGEFLHTVCFIVDISDRIKKEEEMKELTLELTHRNQELEQFAYVTSHDLQEPLRIVSNYCQLLKEKCDEMDLQDEEIKKWTKYSIDASCRMKNFIKELLDFSRVGRKDKPLEKVDLKDLIKEVIEDFHITIEEKDAIIDIENNMPTVYCIEFRMKQLFHNLISNSLKFCSKDKRPKINISICENDKEYLFCVMDNGVGINSKYFDRIFGIFKRLYSREEYPGSGIGLALCKKIVETHGGRIWVDSSENAGASFYFTFPKI